MPSQFFGLNIAYTGITAANAALNTTGNNISNVETKGYSRQEVTQKAYDALRTFTTYGCAGAGVDTIAIERIRDEFYDVKYWNNQSDLGEYDMKQYYMKQVENYFTDTTTQKGFTTIFNEMYKALGEVSKNAGSTTVKAAFIGAAGNLTEYFKNLASNLQNTQKDTNSEIKVKTDNINTIAASIASLNKQINVIELTGVTANELRDQRTLLVDQLSSVVDVQVVETPVFDTNDESRVTGANRYQVKIAGGQTLVDTNEYRTLNCVARESYEKVNQSDVDGLYDIKWSDGSEFGIYAGNLGGELRALIELRDGNNGENFKGTVSKVDVAANTVTIDVNAAYLEDINKLNLSDSGGKINLGNKEYYFDSWTLNHDTATDTYSYEFKLSDTTKNPTPVDITRVGKSASIGSSISNQGIPYYMQQMNEWVRSYASTFNKILKQSGSVDGNGDAATNLFTGKYAATGTEFTFAGDAVAGTSMTEDSYYLLTALNFSVAGAMETDANKLATHTTASDGQDKANVITDLIDLKTNKSVLSFRGSSANEFLQCMLSDVSLNANSANTFYKNYSNISKAIDIQRTSVSGVDKDEEALNLVKYQNSYALSSKMIQVLTEIYDRLILSTGV